MNEMFEGHQVTFNVPGQGKLFEFTVDNRYTVTITDMKVSDDGFIDFKCDIDRQLSEEENRDVESILAKFTNRILNETIDTMEV